MRTATKHVATWLGIVAGIGGLEHGFFAMLQGWTPTPGVAFPSMGPPCDPEVSWNACEPAMSILPNFFLTGVLALVLGIAATVWTVRYLQTRGGGWVLLGLSVCLLLFGGGFFPPVIGMIGGLAGTQIHRPVGGQPGILTRSVARLWPWPLVLLVGWLLALFPLGFFFNDALQEVMGYGALLILALLPLAVYSGYASDAARGAS